MLPIDTAPLAAILVPVNEIVPATVCGPTVVPSNVTLEVEHVLTIFVPLKPLGVIPATVIVAPTGKGGVVCGANVSVEVPPVLVAVKVGSVIPPTLIAPFESIVVPPTLALAATTVIEVMFETFKLLLITILPLTTLPATVTFGTTIL